MINPSFSNFIKLINNSVYEFLKPYKNPKITQPETATTIAIINSMKEINHVDIKYFDKCFKEASTGSDILFIFKGTYKNEENMVFKVLFQSKKLHWDEAQPYFRLHKHFTIAGRIDGKKFLNSPTTILLIDKFNKNPSGKKEGQIFKQLNFSRTFKATPLILLYRYFHRKVKKNKSIGMVKSERFLEYEQERNFKIYESKIHKYIRFPTTKDYRFGFIPLPDNNSGFFFPKSSFEIFYEDYLKFMKLEEISPISEIDYDISKIEIEEQDSSGENFLEIENCYSSGKLESDKFEFWKISSTNKNGNEQQMSFPDYILEISFKY